MQKPHFTLFAIIFGCLISIAVRGQSSANYTFTKTNNGSLTDMSSGTTQLVAGGVDDGASAVTNIGFDFWFMGARYTQFSVNSNGYVRLGSTVVANSQYTLATNTNILLTAFGSDCVTGTTGKVHYKLLGTAPNRTLVIEYLNISVIYDAAGAAPYSTYQIKLSEANGNIEYTYGTIVRNSSAGFNSGMEPQYIGFSTSTTSYATVTSSTSAVATSGGATSNQYTLGATVAELSSTTDGSRVVYSFASPVNAPTAANFTAVTSGSATLNWTDNSSNEAGFAIYRSTDGGTTYSYVTTTAANTTSYNITGLSPNTSLYYKVCAIRESNSSFASASTTTLPPGNFTSNSTGGGLWSATSTWTNGVVPSAGDDVTIRDGDNVIVDVNANANNLTVGGGTSGSLTFETTTARTLTTAGNLTINAGASVMTGATGTQTAHVLSVGGDLTNNGILNLSTNNNTAGANLTFTGASNNTFSGTGATTNIMSMTINKGTAATNILEMNPTNFTVKSVATDVSGFLTLTNGTLKISGSFSLTNRIFTAAAYSIPATGGIWLNNANFTVPGQAGNIAISGKLSLSAGTYNIGTLSGNSASLAANSSILIEGGTLNVAGRFGPAAAATIINYSQTGGNVTINQVGYSSSTLACFDLGTSASSSVNISGGTITIQLANGTSSTALSYRNQAGTGSSGVTGGTVYLGNANSGTAKNFVVAGVLPNVEVTNTSAAHTAAFSATSVTYNNTSLNVKINTGNTFDFANNVYLFNGNTIINNGILTHNGSSSRFIVYKPATNVSYSGTGTVTAPMTSLELQNELNFTLDPAVSPVTANRIIIHSGSFVNANRLVLGNGGSTTLTVQIGNTTTATGGGTFDVAPSFNLGTGGQNISYLRANNPIVMGPEVNPTRVLNNLTIDGNTNNVKLTGGALNVTGTLALNTGYLDLNGSTLTLGTSPTALGTLTVTAGRTANGFFKRWIGTATGNIAFPVGSLTDGKAVSINYTAAPATGGTLSARWIPGNSGTNGLPLTEGAIVVSNTSGEGFWRVTADDGLNGGTYIGTFAAGSLTGINDYTKLVLLKRTNSSSPWTLNGTHSATTGSNAAPVLSRSGMSGFSDFGIGSSNVNVLPVTLINFSAFKTGNIHRIEWQTSSEQNNKGFEVQRSADGKNFTALTFVPSKAEDGNSMLKLDYSVDDVAPLKDNCFYRLKQIDKDNKYEYSRIVSLPFNTAAINTVSVYPVPVKNTATVKITSAATISCKFRLLNATGNIVYSGNWNLEKGVNTVSLPMAQFASGNYYLQFTGILLNPVKLYKE